MKTTPSSAVTIELQSKLLKGAFYGRRKKVIKGDTRGLDYNPKL